ncbi:sensor histidine kinase [Sinosporangium siamense]|uniref:Histidine kinase n=1 Tax=Sinosporangium siamense TaxID=1367973 RepID=A0A919V2N1_9ACTN|nr:sensor histidine kinase [Sinosporangium siamense]GII90105.1 hypothetical protein Ssi02_03360 [Sinosporangium siamense]
MTGATGQSAEGSPLRAGAAVCAVLGPVLALTGLVVGVNLPEGWTPPVPATPNFGAALTFPVVGWLLLVQRPRLGLARVMCWGGLLSGFHVAANAVMLRFAADGDLAVAGLIRPVSQTAMTVSSALLALFMPLLSPDDSLPSRRWRPVAVLSTALIVYEVARTVVRPDPPPGAHYAWPQVIPNPLGLQILMPYREVLAAITPVAFTTLVTVSLASLIWKFRRATPEGRRRIGWPLVAFALYVVFFLLGEDFWFLATLWTALIPVAIAFAAMRHGLFDIDTLAGRALVGAGLLAVVSAVYFGVSSASSFVLAGYHQVGGLAAALATGVFLQPLRALLSRGIDRMMFGPQGDPRTLAAALAERVRDTDPAPALGALAGVVRDHLGVAGVAVQVTVPGGDTRVEVGRLGAAPREITLIWYGEPVGLLLIGPPGERRFSRAHHDRLVAAATPYLADVAHAIRMTAALRHSREQALAAREEERRRLGKHLSEGLCRTLAGMADALGEARRDVRGAPLAADLVLAGLRGEMDSVSSEVRLIAHGLNDPGREPIGTSCPSGPGPSAAG